jgi:hypothetical protein
MIEQLASVVVVAFVLILVFAVAALKLAWAAYSNLKDK